MTRQTFCLVPSQQRRGGQVFFGGVQPAVRVMFERTELLPLIVRDHLFWSADQAIVRAYRAHRAAGCAHCAAIDTEPLGMVAH